MKTRRHEHVRTTLITSLALAGIVATLAGCKSSPYEKANQAAENIQATADQIAGLPVQIDKTLASLNNIVDKPQADLRPQFKEFSSSLEDLHSTGKDITAARQTMADRWKEVLAKWDEQVAQIKSEDIKARSEARKKEVADKLQAVKTDYAEAEVAAKPFMNKLRDIEKSLSIDLTPAGVAGLKDSVARINAEAEPLKKSILKVADDFKALGLSMSSVAPAPQPAK